MFLLFWINHYYIKYKQDNYDRVFYEVCNTSYFEDKDISSLELLPIAIQREEYKIRFIKKYIVPQDIILEECTIYLDENGNVLNVEYRDERNR